MKRTFYAEENHYEPDTDYVVIYDYVGEDEQDRCNGIMEHFHTLEEARARANVLKGCVCYCNIDII